MATIRMVAKCCEPELSKRISPLPIAGTAKAFYFNRTCPQSCLPDGIPEGRSSFVLREDETLTRSQNSFRYFGSLPFDCQSNGQRQLCGDGF